MFLTLYATSLIIALGTAPLLIFRAFGPRSYKDLFDKYLWTTEGDEN